MKRTTKIWAMGIWAMATAGMCGAYEWERTETALALRDGDRIVWRFSAGPEAAKPYFHPVTLPDGKVVTDHAPQDHAWHLGVWFTFRMIDGINFWTEKDGRLMGPGRIEIADLVFDPCDDFSADISFSLTYLNKDDPLIRERRRYEIAAPGTDAHMISAYHSFTAVKDVTIDRYDYGGTTFRPAPDVRKWRWMLAEPFAGQRPFDFPEREPEKYAKIKGLIRPPTKWMAIVEGAKGETRGIAILDHPSNPRYPTPWSGVAYNADIWLEEEMRLACGETFALRYRMLFFDR